MFLRKVKTASGATAVQIAERRDRRDRVIEHLGSAHTEAELAALMEAGRAKIHAGQGLLNLGLDADPGEGGTGLGSNRRPQPARAVYGGAGGLDGCCRHHHLAGPDLAEQGGFRLTLLCALGAIAAAFWRAGRSGTAKLPRPRVKLVGLIPSLLRGAWLAPHRVDKTCAPLPPTL